MTFFGLTQIGPQEPLRVGVWKSPYKPTLPELPGQERLPPIQSAQKDRPSIVPIDQLSGFGPGHKGSQKEWYRLRYKHTRMPSEHHQLNRAPQTAGQEYGWWNKDAPIKEKEPWTYVKRHIHVESEMTRFVKSMALTNREFKLF